MLLIIITQISDLVNEEYSKFLYTYVSAYLLISCFMLFFTMHILCGSEKNILKKCFEKVTSKLV